MSAPQRRVRPRSTTRKTKQPRLLPALAPIAETDALDFDALTTKPTQQDERNETMRTALPDHQPAEVRLEALKAGLISMLDKAKPYSQAAKQARRALELLDQDGTLTTEQRLERLRQTITNFQGAAVLTESHDHPLSRMRQ